MVHTCDLADAAQRRLDYSCVEWQWWWVHLLIFTFAQLMAVASHCRNFLQDGVQVGNRSDGFSFAYDAWHGSIGALGLMALLLTPAQVTYRYNLLPRKFLVGLRCAGATH